MITRDIVFILGAGASRSEKAPLQNQVFEMFFKYAKEKYWITETFSEQIVEIRRYFRDFYDINPDVPDVIYPTFEEALGIIDFALLKNESFKGWNKERLSKLRNYLVFTIAKTLDESLKGSNKVHDKLIRRLESHKILQRTGFISLNYDIVIDNALLPYYPSYPMDYCVDFMNYDRSNDFARPVGEKTIPLIKIHGSMNWLYCPTCNQVERTASKATEAFYKSEPCRQCKTSMEPLIIPPTFSKDMSNTFIKDVFTKAEYLLRQGKHIFFCGYSFPDADLHFKYLIKKAEVYSDTRKKIFIVDPDTSQYFKDKYNRFYRDRSNIKYIESDFQTFVNTFEFANLQNQLK